MNTKVSKLQMRAKAFLDVASELRELTPEDRAVLSCVIDACKGIKFRASEAARYRAAAHGEEAWKSAMTKITALQSEVERLRTLHEGAVHDWRNACELMNKAETEVKRLRKAISNVMTDDQLSTMVPAIGMTIREAMRGRAIDK